MFEKLKDKLLTVVRTQEEVQQEVEKRFPYEYKDVPGFTLTLTQPKVWLLDEKDLVELSVDICVKVLLIGEYHGHIGMRGELAYDRENKRIVLNNPELIRLDIPDLAEKWKATAQHILSVIITTHLHELLYYPMPDGVVYSMVKSLQIENKKLKIAFI